MGASIVPVLFLCLLFGAGTHAILDSIIGFLNGGLPNVYGEQGDHSWYFNSPPLYPQDTYDQNSPPLYPQGMYAPHLNRQKRSPQHNAPPVDAPFPIKDVMHPVKFFTDLVKAKILILTTTRALQAVGYDVQTNRDGIPIVPTNPGIGQRVFMAVKAALDNLGPSTIEYRLRQGMGELITNIAFDAARDTLVSAGFNEATVEYYRGDVRFILQTALNVASLKLFLYVQKYQIPVEAAKLLAIAGKSFVPIVDTAAAAVANPLIQVATH